MALVCNLTLNVNTCVAGASPAPMMTLQVYNPNATAVAVTAVQMAYYSATNGSPINGTIAPQVPATTPGQIVVCPALSSITFGPMPVAVGSAAPNPFWVMTPAAGPVLANPQAGELPITQIIIGATVYGSDGSANEAGRVGLTVSPNPFPPPTYQGGWLQFNAPNNFVTGLGTGVL